MRNIKIEITDKVATHALDLTVSIGMELFPDGERAKCREFRINIKQLTPSIWHDGPGSISLIEEDYEKHKKRDRAEVGD